MQEPVIRRLHDVFGYCLELKSRLDRGETMSVAIEHDKLRSLILADRDLDANPAYNVEFHHSRMSDDSTKSDKSPYFFGGRYALACLIDELFIADTPNWFSEEWSTMSMEQTLYGGTQDRAWRFWDQARKALLQAHPEAICAFLWAVMLGFRGTPEDAEPEVDPYEWVSQSKARLLKISAAEFDMPPEREVPLWVPPLRGREKFTRMMRIGAVVLAVIAFALTLTFSASIGR